MKERTIFFWMAALFAAVYLVPWSSPEVSRALGEAFLMLQDYARKHVITCLVPAFFIAGAVAVFVSQASVLKYFGPRAPKILSYSVASVSGSVLAVCSCTVLPLFAGIYTRGAGIGPATAFLYSGPAINVLAVVLTARVLGWQLGLARAVGAILFALATGLIMAFLFREDEARRQAGQLHFPGENERSRTLGQDGLFMLVMVLILVAAAFAEPDPGSAALWRGIFAVKWYLAAAFLALLLVMLRRWFKKDEIRTWVESTWDFTKQIMPLLALGVLAAGFLLGRPGHLALIPEQWIVSLLGGNSPGANFFASLAGSLMYFATLTEIPILEGLLGSGMGQGPALALLLAGPAVSLPNMIVIVGVLGIRKTAVYVAVVVIMSTLAGVLYGTIVS
ncbi:MAG TPA: permease [Deltaproteobacteria bacterium]|nr:permease [Deltaproteobacteria bacterium]